MTQEINPVTNLPVFIPKMPIDVSDADAAEVVPQKEGEIPDAPDTPVITVPEAAALPAPDPNVLTDTERQRLAQLETNQAEVLRIQTINDTASEAQRLQTQVYQELIAEGYDEQSSQRMMTRIVQERQNANTRVRQQEEQAVQLQRFTTGQQAAARKFGTDNGVDPAALSGFKDPNDMEAYAKLLKVNNDNTKRIGILEGKTVDEGIPDGGLPTGSVPLAGAALAEKALDINFYETMNDKQREDLKTFLATK